MESYTTISVKPELKKALKKLKGNSQTYGEYIQDQVPEDKMENVLEEIREEESE